MGWQQGTRDMQRTTEGTAGPRSRNVWIDMCRLVASITIMFFHFPIDGAPFRFESGALFVEYFFMLTGYFALSHMRRRGYDTGCIGPYMRRFYMRVIPYVAVGVLLEYASEMVTAFPDTPEMLRKLAFLPFELLLLQSTNIYHSAYHVLWYLSITMICLPVVMCARKRLAGIWGYLVVVGPLLCYGLVMQTVGTLRVNKDILDASQRAIGGMLLGGLIAILSGRLREARPRGWRRVALLVAEVGSLSMAMFLMTRPELEKTRHDSVTVFLLLCSLVISLSSTTPTAGLPAFKGSSLLGPVSLSIYCLHYGVFDLIQAISGQPLDSMTTVIGGVGVVVSSVLLASCMTAVTKARRGGTSQAGAS